MRRRRIKINPGERYGKLTVIEELNTKDRTVRCKCDCGNIIDISVYGVKRGHVKSCGCARIESNHLKKKHGKEPKRLYPIWRGMRDRCYRKASVVYKYYGERGITVCDEWNHDFAKFRDWAIASGYKDNLTLDRIDNSLGYSPDNCRWATVFAQQGNRTDGSKSIYVYESGKKIPLIEYCVKNGISYHRAFGLTKRGVKIEEIRSQQIKKYGFINNVRQYDRHTRAPKNVTHLSRVTDVTNVCSIDKRL